MGHPRVGRDGCRGFLSTHNQALSALLFLYREVLCTNLLWLSNIGHPQQTKRIPSVLAKDQVLAQMEGFIGACCTALTFAFVSKTWASLANGHVGRVACYLMQTERTIFRSVNPIMTFSMPSIFRVRMPPSTAAEKISATRARS